MQLCERNATKQLTPTAISCYACVIGIWIYRCLANLQYMYIVVRQQNYKLLAIAYTYIWSYRKLFEVMPQPRG